jgi:Xaa-Pro aminopeptidase
MDLPIKVFKDERKRGYLNPEGSDKPLKSPVPHDVVVSAQAYRLRRVREHLALHDCGALLLYDPVNIHYALGATNMQVWTLHNPIRYALILAAGPAILFEFRDGKHLAAGYSGIDEVRTAIAWMYMTSDSRAEERLANWAGEIDSLVRQHGAGNHRVACDRLDPPGVHALERLGLQVVDGQQITERARSIKSADELAMMHWTVRVAEAGMAEIYEVSEPGRTECELYAELHYENVRSGGDWMETKLLTCGPRTNPWYQEASDRPCQLGEMIAFDTDMIGPYGYCADVSRSWTCGHLRMTDTQRRIYGLAREQVEHNLSLLRAGLTFREFNERSWRIPEKNQPHRYSLALHGVGMDDEWPTVPLHPDFDGAYEGHFEENMVVSVESLMAEDATESVKLETQVVITANGAERLDTFPWEQD